MTVIFSLVESSKICSMFSASRKSMKDKCLAAAKLRFSIASNDMLKVWNTESLSVEIPEDFPMYFSCHFGTAANNLVKFHQQTAYKHQHVQ